MNDYFSNNQESVDIAKIAKTIGKVLAGIAAASLLAMSVTRIPANTVGVKVSAIGGVQKTTLQTGYHLKVPIIDKVYKMPTSVQTSKMEGRTLEDYLDQHFNRTLFRVEFRTDDQLHIETSSNYLSFSTAYNDTYMDALAQAIPTLPDLDA